MFDLEIAKELQTVHKQNVNYFKWVIGVNQFSPLRTTPEQFAIRDIAEAIEDVDTDTIASWIHSLLKERNRLEKEVDETRLKIESVKDAVDSILGEAQS